MAAEALVEAAREMYVDGKGVPAASSKPPIATVASKELVIIQGQGRRGRRLQGGGIGWCAALLGPQA